MHIRGNFTIQVLDDGTGNQYLERIQDLFPSVNIHYSDLRTKKLKDLDLHYSGRALYNSREVPVEFWTRTIKAGASDIFLLLEEDAWLTEEVDVTRICDMMRLHNIMSTKLHWGNDTIAGRITTFIDGTVGLIAPSLPLSANAVVVPFLRNTLKIRSILMRAGILKPAHLLPYYSLYTVSSAFFNKAYWLNLWTESRNTIRETDQLLKAVLWYRNKPGSAYARTTTERVRTSYISACTNQTDVAFDMLHLNRVLSCAWYDGEWNAMRHFPADFAIDDIARCLAKDETSRCTVHGFREWIRAFQEPYKRMGIRTESVG
jgi:hypothetical protein